MPARVPLTALFLVALLVAPAAAQEGEVLPRIFLEKKVFSDTAGGKRSFYETHTVEEGESLWKILERRERLTPERFAERLKEFRRANPKVADPSRISPGQELLVPSVAGREPADDGRTDAYRVKMGDALLKILASRGVPLEQRKMYLDAIRETNPSVKDVNRILAGTTLRIPTEAYFTGEKPPGEPEKSVPAEIVVAAAPPEVKGAAPDVLPAPALTRDVPSAPGQDALAAGKPEAELLIPKAPAPGVSVVETGKASTDDEVVVPPASSPYRGLLSDLFLSLGEKWIDRGTMFLPLPSLGDLVLQLSDFPLVRFSGGAQALIDFRGGIPPRVRDAISAQWGSIRVVSLADAGGAGERIDRVLRVSGYHSVKEGISRPVVMGETVSVALPARWVVQRSEDSLLSGDLVLVLEVPEKPDPEYLAVLRYARRVGLRVLPYADDPKAAEGFLVGVGEEASAGEIPVALVVPKTGGLPAVDIGLALLGIPAKTGDRLRLGGSGDPFRLVVSPERLFKAGGKEYVVDTGKMSPAIRSILRDSGYAVFPAGKEVSGKEILQRLMKVAGVATEERKEYLLAGGREAGYEVRITGTFLSLSGPPGGPGRKVVLVGRRIHSATRVLLGEMGMEIVEW